MLEFGFLLDHPEPTKGSALCNKYHEVKNRILNQPETTLLCEIYRFLDRLRVVDMNGNLVPISLSDIRDAAEMHEISNVSNLIYLVTMIDSWQRSEHAKKMQQNRSEVLNGGRKQ